MFISAVMQLFCLIASQKAQISKNIILLKFFVYNQRCIDIYEYSKIGKSIILHKRHHNAFLKIFDINPATITSLITS